MLEELETGESIIRHVKYDLRSKRKKATVTAEAARSCGSPEKRTALRSIAT